MNNDYTLTTLCLKMCELAKPTNVYTTKWLQNKIKVYGTQVQANVVWFKALKVA